jgi:hypothetical protein
MLPKIGDAPLYVVAQQVVDFIVCEATALALVHQPADAQSPEPEVIGVDVGDAALFAP